MYTDPSGHFRELSKYALDGMVIRNTSAQYATPAQKKEQAKDIAKTLSRQTTTVRAPAAKPTPTPTPAAKPVEKIGGLVLSENASKDIENKKELVRAVSYLSTSEKGKELIEQMENLAEPVTIEFFKDGDFCTDMGADHINRYREDNRTIYWNPSLGLVLRNGKSVMSASMILAHEMGHAWQHVHRLLDRSSDEKRLETEEANIQTWEKPIAQQLGEPFREKYRHERGYHPMSTSTDWGRISIESPWWENWWKAPVFVNQNPWKP